MATASEPAARLANWEAIKSAEKKSAEKERAEKQQPQDGSSASLLDEVPRSFPARSKRQSWAARRRRSASTGRTVTGLLRRSKRSAAEIEAEIEAGQRLRTAVEGEVGDLLFTVVNLARHLNVDPELALRRTNGKFRRRFAAMEQASDVPLSEQSAQPSSRRCGPGEAAGSGCGRMITEVASDAGERIRNRAPLHCSNWLLPGWMSSKPAWHCRWRPGATTRWMSFRGGCLRWRSASADR